MIKKTSLKTGKLTQRSGFLIAGSIIFASGFALGLSALAGNMNLPEQNMLSSNALQPGGATQQTQADSKPRFSFQTQAKLRRISVTTRWLRPGLP